MITQGEEITAATPQTKKPPEDFGLGVAQIVITAATPMTEEPEQPFPPPEDVVVNHTEADEEPPQPQTKISEPIIEEPEEIEEVEAAIVISSSTGSDGETTGPSTAENSVSQALPTEVGEPKQVVGGRASIPDELEPHQLACLQNLKESNA